MYFASHGISALRAGLREVGVSVFFCKLGVRARGLRHLRGVRGQAPFPPPPARSGDDT